jgi:hypothetical protein
VKKKGKKKIGTRREKEDGKSEEVMNLRHKATPCALFAFYFPPNSFHKAL